jgi:hypothetical protein
MKATWTKMVKTREFTRLWKILEDRSKEIVNKNAAGSILYMELYIFSTLLHTAKIAQSPNYTRNISTGTKHFTIFNISQLEHLS